MRAVRRRTLIVACLLSWLLCVTALLDWLESYTPEYFPPAATGFKWHPSRATPYRAALCLLFAVASVGFTWLLVRSVRLRRQRMLSGGCPVCGYDLRASPDRCPECGTPVTRAPGQPPASSPPTRMS
jgi:hypothetical protein